MMLIINGCKGRKAHELMGIIPKSVKVRSLRGGARLYGIGAVNFRELNCTLNDGEKIVFWPLEEVDCELMWGLFRLVESRGNVLWFAPKPEQMQVMSDKLAAKKILAASGFKILPVIDKYDEDKSFVVKLRRGSGSRGISFLSGAELENMNVADEYFVEEAMQFKKYVGVSGVAFSGEVSFIYSHERVVTKDSFGGASRVAKVVALDEDLAQLARGFLAEHSYTGCFMFEFGIADGQFILIEFNPRLWGSFPIAANNFERLIAANFCLERVDYPYYDFFVFCSNFEAIKFCIFMFWRRSHKVFLSPSLRGFLRN